MSRESCGGCFPFVPVMAMMGILPTSFKGRACPPQVQPHCGSRRKVRYAYGSPARRSLPGWPRHFSVTGVRRSVAMISMPQISSPMILAIRSHMMILAGCTSSVTSVLVPPVDRFAVGLAHQFACRGMVSVYNIFVQHFLRKLVNGDLCQHFRVHIHVADLCWFHRSVAVWFVCGPSPLRNGGRCAKRCANEFIINDEGSRKSETGDVFLHPITCGCTVLAASKALIWPAPS